MSDQLAAFRAWYDGALARDREEGRGPVLVATCGECVQGVVYVETGCGGCSGYPGIAHEPSCGVEPCPRGCWDRLHRPRCAVCRDTGAVLVPEADGEGAYDTACTACDLPYPGPVMLP